MPSFPLTEVGHYLWKVVKVTGKLGYPFCNFSLFPPALCIPARTSRGIYGRCLSTRLRQTLDRCSQVFISLAMGLHPSCYSDDILHVMSMATLGTPYNRPARLIRHRGPHPDCCAESHVCSATKLISARWRCNRTDMKSSSTMDAHPVIRTYPKRAVVPAWRCMITNSSAVSKTWPIEVT